MNNLLNILTIISMSAGYAVNQSPGQTAVQAEINIESDYLNCSHLIYREPVVTMLVANTKPITKFKG
jgi:hypothetical protein